MHTAPTNPPLQLAPRVFPIWGVVVALCLAYTLFVVVMRGDVLAIVTLGTRFSEGIAAAEGGTDGYDGQFVYYIARDPLNAAQFIDIPAYRYQRILLPILGWGVSLGQTSLLPWALLAVNLAAVGVGTFLVQRWLMAHGHSAWLALGYGLSLGVLGAARMTTTEPLAYALALGGLWLALRSRYGWAALLFALAALTKETTLLIAAGVGVYLLLVRRELWQALRFGLIALLPFVAWQMILRGWLGEFGIGAGGESTTSFELIPFLGWLRIATTMGIEIFIAWSILIVPLVIIPCLWGLWRCLRDVQQRTITLLSVIVFINCAIMLVVPLSTYRDLVGILRFIVGMQIALMLYAAERGHTRLLAYSRVWMLGLVMLPVFDFVRGDG
jgi:hypothetical protein